MNFSEIPSPCYVVDEKQLRKNLELIKGLKQRAGVSVIVAFKGYALWKSFYLVREYLDGATASSLNEARLCFEEMESLAHTYSVAYTEDDFQNILKYSQHISFNSLAQFRKFFPSAKKFKKHAISCGVRINPDFSVVETELYNPGKPGSRLGIDYLDINESLPPGVEGFHIHCLCESSAQDTSDLLDTIESKLGKFLPKLKWLNIGGGHLMTRAGYDLVLLENALLNFKQKYPNLEIILEPGSAIGWDTGVLRAKILDIVENRGVRTIITDVSFTAHMPDTLEMPYRPRIRGASEPREGLFNYQIGGTSCLSGDYMTEYGFETLPKIGDDIIFEDMIHYTMVKTSTFNGVPHPSIGMWTEENKFLLFKKFGYLDYKNRLS